MTATISDEIAWAFRKLLEAEAADSARACSTTSTGRRTTLLDLVDHLSDCRRDAPILLVCMAGRSCSTVGRAGPAGR